MKFKTAKPAKQIHLNAKLANKTTVQLQQNNANHAQYKTVILVLKISKLVNFATFIIDLPKTIHAKFAKTKTVYIVMKIQNNANNVFTVCTEVLYYNNAMVVQLLNAPFVLKTLMENVNNANKDIN